MFSALDKRKLVLACAVNKHAGKNNPDLDKTIREMMATYPWMYHTPASLASRRFYDEPRPSRENPTAAMSYVRAYK